MKSHCIEKKQLTEKLYRGYNKTVALHSGGRRATRATLNCYEFPPDVFYPVAVAEGARFV